MEYRNRASANEMVKQFFFTSGFDYPLLPVIKNDTPKLISNANWGLIPSWSKDKDIRKFTLNAKQETVFEKPSFRTPIREKRCLILADGFFEWKQVKGKKYPHYITLKNNDLFSFAGIWDEWLDKETGEFVKSYSILTTAANELMADIHNTKKRMPVILPREVEFEWLNNGLKEKDIKDLIRLSESVDLKAHTVAKSPIDVPGAVLHHRYSELEEKELF